MTHPLKSVFVPPYSFPSSASTLAVPFIKAYFVHRAPYPPPLPLIIMTLRCRNYWENQRIGDNPTGGSSRRQSWSASRLRQRQARPSPNAIPRSMYAHGLMSHLLCRSWCPLVRCLRTRGRAVALVSDTYIHIARSVLFVLLSPTE